MKKIDGKVVSVKMKNTAVVEIARQTIHPLYKKIVKRTKRIKVDTGEKTVAIGDRVTIVETRPISKEKHFKLTVK